MKKTMIIAALLMSSISMTADDGKYLTVAYSGIEESITLATVKKITFDATSVIVNTTEGDKKFPLAEMKKMTFTATPTAIEAMPIESEGLKMQDGNLLVSGKGTLRIYNASGALVGISAVEGEQVVGLQGLQRGLYIVNMGDQTIKIQK